ncbi:MAG: hypothetical protein ACLT98_11960 [Eggerthellaceae bacterium]
MLPIVFSVAAVYALSRAFMSDITRRQQGGRRPRRTQRGRCCWREVVAIVMAVGSLVAGVAYGLSHAGFGAMMLVAHSDWILTALMFSWESA